MLKATLAVITNSGEVKPRRRHATNGTESNRVYARSLWCRESRYAAPVNTETDIQVATIVETMAGLSKEVQITSLGPIAGREAVTIWHYGVAL